ncbi:hypothetical protein CT19431_P70018 [Cupriavidus taiwanensis]|nr:hypothetical protein CT19431_P70018 [Cupriavidus taiwanensis]
MRPAGRTKRKGKPNGLPCERRHEAGRLRKDVRGDGGHLFTERERIDQRRTQLYHELPHVLRTLGPAAPEGGRSKSLELRCPFIAVQRQAGNEVSVLALEIVVLVRWLRTCAVHRQGISVASVRVVGEVGNICTNTLVPFQGVGGLIGQFQSRHRAVGTVQQRGNVDFCVKRDEPLHLAHRLAAVIDTADLDFLLGHPELDAHQPATGHRNSLHGGVSLLQDVNRGRGHFDETKARCARHGEIETGREVAMSALVLRAFLRVTNAIRDILVLTQDDGAAAPHALGAVGAGVTHRWRVHLAVAPTVGAILGEVLSTAVRPCHELVGHVAQPVVEREHHGKAPEAMSIAVVAVLAVAPHDVLGQRRVGEVRGTAGEPRNVLRHHRHLDAGRPGDLGRNTLEALASSQAGIVDPHGFGLLARGLGQDLDAGPDLADDRRPHGPLF